MEQGFLNDLRSFSGCGWIADEFYGFPESGRGNWITGYFSWCLWLGYHMERSSAEKHSVLGSVGTQPAGQVVSRLYQQKLSILVTNTASHRGKNSVYRLDAVCGENREFGI
jgi:hypothetical protein